jgi:DNA-directed RNA polymerase specialized sigma24 family protein
MAIDWQRFADDDYYASVCTTLYETHRRGMLRYCVTRLGDALGAEVMQEVVVTMVKTLRTYRPGPPVESWLFGMAKQKCQQTLRNRTRRQDIATAFGKDISEDARGRLERYSWPGNVRELEEVIEQAVARCQGPMVTAQDLPQSLRESLRIMS